jgi:hypothetical protein
VTGFLSLLLVTGIPVSFGNLSDSPFIQADRRGDLPRRSAYVSPPESEVGLDIGKFQSLANNEVINKAMPA